jgi:hypothetical protein
MCSLTRSILLLHRSLFTRMVVTVGVIACACLCVRARCVGARVCTARWRTDRL